MIDKNALKRAYKENPPPAGIYQITNTVSGKIFIGKGINVRGILNSQQAQLKFGSHQNSVLQADWNQYGEGEFLFDVVDQLDTANKSPQEIREDLAMLEELWLEKLQPYGERGYNKIPHEKSTKESRPK